MVVNSETLEDVATFRHRKEEISDIKFSPGLLQIYMYILVSDSL